MDHALDAANLPWLSAGTVVTWTSDIYTRAFTMIGCGLVFNSQLVVYRHKKRMIKPPANGPESQTMLIAAQVLTSLVFCVVGRFHPVVVVVMYGVSIFANLVQAMNFLFFWSHLSWSIAGDHVRFILPVVGFALLAVTGIISDFVFEVGSALLAFRLSGAYVLFTVANKHKDAEEEAAASSSSSTFKRAKKPVLQSS